MQDSGETQELPMVPIEIKPWTRNMTSDILDIDRSIGPRQVTQPRLGVISIWQLVWRKLEFFFFPEEPSKAERTGEGGDGQSKR